MRGKQKSPTKELISIRLPKDVIEDLKQVAPMLGFSGYQPLILFYIGKQLRQDLAKLEEDKGRITSFIESLKRKGVSDEIIAEAIAEVAV